MKTTSGTMTNIFYLISPTTSNKKCSECAATESFFRTASKTSLWINLKWINMTARVLDKKKKKVICTYCIPHTIFSLWQKNTWTQEKNATVFFMCPSQIAMYFMIIATTLERKNFLLLQTTLYHGHSQENYHQ